MSRTSAVARTLIATGLAALLASPAAAVVRNYFSQGAQLICTTTEVCVAPPAPDPGDPFYPLQTEFSSGGNFTPSFDQTERRDFIRIDDVGGGANPVLVDGYNETFFTDSFDTAAETGVPGSFALVFVDTITQLGSSVGTRTGDVVDFGPLTVTTIGGKGQKCTETHPGGCAAGNLPVGIWQPSVPPASPVDTGPYYFSSDFLSFERPKIFRYFDLNPLLGVDIYGESGDWTGVAPYTAPLLAPLGALALAGSLAFMGIRILRRERQQQ